jgi:uncharacterized RDD family membrane protein YckC
VIQTCKQCGAINQSSAENCCFCNARLSIEAEQAALGVSNPSAGNGAESNYKINESPALQPAWRSEVKSRLRTYRERRRRSGGDESQTALEFEQESGDSAGPETDDTQGYGILDGPDFPSPEQAAFEQQEQHGRRPGDPFDDGKETPATHIEEQYEDPLQATLAAASALMHEESPAEAAEQEDPFQQLLIDVSRPPEVEPEAAAEKPAISYGDANPIHDSTLYPVGELRIRRRAGMLDAAVLFLSYAGILALFAAFGGRLAPVRLDALVCGSMALLLYAQYFTLFTMLGGATPGMLLTGLRVVSFDGSAPEPRQLMLRSLGYVISGGMAMLGFLWAFWDEDHLSWHDRISQTYLISAESVGKPASAAEAHDGSPLAHL